MKAGRDAGPGSMGCGSGNIANFPLASDRGSENQFSWGRRKKIALACWLDAGMFGMLRPKSPEVKRGAKNKNYPVEFVERRFEAWLPKTHSFAPKQAAYRRRGQKPLLASGAAGLCTYFRRCGR